ncbi:MAG: cadherin-like domain-containing protein [Oscillospiraceae bacterium]|nr:cadherin-like domain-containing protein [Oscillospiraceae bacterium]
MKFVRVVSLACAALAVVGLAGGALAAEVDCDTTYCFTASDFSGEEQIVGICITELPDPNTGTAMLGQRVLREGDILTAEQVSQMTFAPLRTQVDATATVTYLPIYENRVEKSTTMTIAIRGKEDKAPVAEDFAIETYKNLPNTGTLKVSDPEGESLTYTLVRAPKRGEVTIQADGSFTYTPKKNKVGVDSFVYTAADPAGNVSRQATVTVQILKPSDKNQYTDTVGLDCRFEAEWLKNTGLFTGEKVGGESCFFPEKTVSRGDFLTMAVKALDIPVEEMDYSGIPEDVPMWLKPYVGAALRSGLLEGWPQTETGSYDMESPITELEAAVLLQNALDLSMTETAAELSEELPVWAADSVAVMNQYGVALGSENAVTRAQAAEVLYQISILSVTAPGMTVFRMQ